MPLVRKRRADAEQSPEPGTQSQRRRRSPSAASVEEDGDDYAETTQLQDDAASRDQMVKKLVRLALASEYARQPIRRADVGTKVLGQYSRQFKAVFEEAQTQLRDKFGMEMIELPIKEKVTISQRRDIEEADRAFVSAAQRADKASTSSKAWVLTTILPSKYASNPTIIPPPHVPTSTTESTYIGLYTFIIALISLSGGSISEAKLERYMRRANADQYTPIDRTERLLARLCKEGYLVKFRDASSGEEVVEYMVGPRGKVEIGPEGVAGMIKTVYAADEAEDLDQRIQRSLNLGSGWGRNKIGNDPGANERRAPGRPRRDDEDDEGDFDEESDEG
ncbi:MAG: hypothetical protein M1819_003887 [Sarea resinae]|nr:MAG: hypothetical protein M1819_003887 [Sarea resinae]